MGGGVLSNHDGYLGALQCCVSVSKRNDDARANDEQMGIQSDGLGPWPNPLHNLRRSRRLVSRISTVADSHILIATCSSGYQLWKLFLGLDSDRYPLKNYGDIAYRVYGQWARYIVNILQSLQFFLNVGLIIISSGQSISQLSKGQFCFVGCLLVCTVAGLLVGQIRTLAKFGYIANLAVWMNIFVMIFT